MISRLSITLGRSGLGLSHCGPLRRPISSPIMRSGATGVYPTCSFWLAQRGYVTKEKLAEGLSEVRMPQIMTAKEGTVDKWLVKEGDEFAAGAPLCEVTLEDLTVSVDAPSNGFVTSLLLPAGEACKVDEPIVQIASSKDVYLAFLDSRRILEHDKELVKEAAEVIEVSTKKPDTTTLLREIRHLIDEKKIDQESDFVKKLLSLARKGNPDLMAVFEASFEGTAFNSDTFDVKFFIDNAKEVVAEAK